MKICPNCHQELKDDEYYETTEYHNALTGHCKKCGYDGHWGDFFNT